MIRRVGKVALATTTGIATGTLVAIVALALAGLVVIALIAVTRSSPQEQARKAVQGLFVDAVGQRVAGVESCTKVRSDSDADVYRCRIKARSCNRHFQFVIYDGYDRSAAPYSVSAYAFQRPCAFPSD